MRLLWSVYLLVSFCTVVFSNCPPLQKKSGITLKCKGPNNGRSYKCGDSQAPAGTTADYKCTNHYVSPFGDAEGGKLTCQSNGKWTRLTQYEEFACRIDCGKPTAAVSGTSPVVVFGEVATRENFPWHVTIFRSNGPGTRYQFFCGGSLISPSNKGFVVLTAAHCVTSSLRTYEIRPVEDFKVVLGAVSSNLTENENTPGTQILSVKGAKAHPRYNFDTIQNDVAIMKLKSRIKLSNYISPVCFPNNEMANMEITGTGLIPGYGVDQNTHITAVLNFARLPVTDTSICNYALGKRLTSIEFCAGYESGSSICSGDSGGGLVFSDKLSKRIYVQGIASNVDRRPLQDLKYCQNYNTFTRVSSYVDWVQDTIDEFFDLEEDDFDEDDDDESKYPQQAELTKNRDEEFRITVYQNIMDKDDYVEWRMRNCSSVPSNWNQGVFWIEAHGKCLEFFEGTVCTGRSLQFQSKPESSTFKWNFPNYKIHSVSLCKYPPGSGTYPESPDSGGGGTTPGVRPPLPSPITGGGSVPIIGNDFEKVALQLHNLYRTKHGVPPLKLNERLNTAAQTYAERLLLQNTLQGSGQGGENLFEIKGSSETFEKIVKQAVNKWYDSIKKYNWMSPTATSFSQVIWKSTKELGVGVARAGRRTIVVARYNPPGNVYNVGPLGERTKFFRENVLPPR